MNYFEQPVAQTFMDTYAPLPFQELAMLGAAYKKEKDETEAAIDEFRSKYGDFTSMSEYDTQAWDQETMGKLQPALLEMASDPEKIKSQEFQAGIRSAIRSVDAAKLSALKQNAENFKIRAAEIAKLKSEGKYKESWDPINMAQWRTIGPNGQLNMMTDLSPIEYKSLHDIAAPYSQALKDQYLGKIDRYRYWKGIDESQIRNALSTVATDIFNTPQGQAWYRDISAELAMQGVTDPNAVREEMMNRLVQSQKDYMRKNMEYDTAAIQEDTIALKRRIAAGKEQPDNPPARYTDMIRLDGKRYLNVLAANQEMEKRATFTNPFKTLVHDNFTKAIGREYEGTTLSGTEMVNGTKSVIDLLSTDNSLDGAHAILGQVANVSRKEDGTITYTMKDSRYLENPVTVVASMEGVKVDKNFKTFDRLMREGKFTNLQIEPATYGGLFNYIDKNGNFKQKQRVYVTVKESDLLPNSLTKGEKEIIETHLAMNGAQKIYRPSTTRVSETETVRKNEDAKLAGSTSSRTISNTGDNYITFEAFINVPDDETGHQGTMVTNINSAYDRTNMTGSQAGEIYPLQQADAFYGNQNSIDLDEILSE